MTPTTTNVPTLPFSGRAFCGWAACFVAAIAIYVADMIGKALLSAGDVTWNILLPSGLLPAVLPLGLCWLGLRLSRRGKRLRILPGEMLLARDRRPIVLYLRSFADDGTESTSASSFAPFSMTGIQLEPPTDEEDLIAALKVAGPCIAIGNPKESLREIGASRLYFEPREWQHAVVALMRRASLIIARAAPSPGFVWELQRLKCEVDPSKVLLYFGSLPDSRRQHQQYEQLKEIVDQYLPRPLPAALGGTRFVAFANNWQAVAVPPLSKLQKAIGQGITGSQAFNIRRELSAVVPSLRPGLLDRLRAFWAHIIAGIVALALLINYVRLMLRAM